MRRDSDRQTAGGGSGGPNGGRLYGAGTALAIAGLAWGGVFPVAKAALAFMDPFTFTFVRYLFTAAIFLVILAAVEGLHCLNCQGHKFRVWALGTTGFVGFGVVAFVGLQGTRAEHAAVIVALLPLIAILVNWAMRGLRPSLFATCCVAIGIVGVALVVTAGDFSRFASGGSAVADLLVLFGVICWVFYTLGRATVGDWSTLRYTALTSAYSVGSLLAVAAIAWYLGYGRVPAVADIPLFASLTTYTIIFASVIAVLGWNVGISIISPAKGVLFVNLVPVTAFGVAVAQGRTPYPTEIAGVALVIVALVANSIYTPQP